MERIKRLQMIVLFCLLTGCTISFPTISNSINSSISNNLLSSTINNEATYTFYINDDNVDWQCNYVYLLNQDNINSTFPGELFESNKIEVDVSSYTHMILSNGTSNYQTIKIALNEFNDGDTISIINQTIDGKYKVVKGIYNPNVDRVLKMYAMNDFHGAVVENKKNNEYGFLKQGTFFKNKGKEENTLILNSGDMWQGSIESNNNYGEFLSKAMNNIEFDSFTLGNHEFDWGSSYIKQNRALKDKDDEYQTPFLAANIYNYNMDKKETLDHASDLGDKYVIKYLENGLKIGIIGVIGKDQITSISSQFVDNYTFLDPTKIIKDLSDELRLEKFCDVIVVDAHASVSQIYNEEIVSISSVSNKRYVDAVFCAHSHYFENETYNGVPFVQGGSNGKSYSEIKLKVSSNGDVTCQTRNNYASTELTNMAESSFDSELVELYNEYKEKTDKIGNEVLGNIVGGFNSYGTNSVANIVTAAIGSYAIDNNFNIDYAMANDARASLDVGELTYAELYKALPFDNIVYIVDVKGSDIIKQSTYNYIYRINLDAIQSNSTYTIAVLDYLVFHRNSSRQYDYFPSANAVDYLKKDGYSNFNYRDITADYIRNNKIISNEDYNSNLDLFNKNKLQQSIV